MSEQPKPNSKEALMHLQREVENIITLLGYEVVAFELSTAGGKKLTLFIDFLNNNDDSRRIGLNDCLTVNKAVDELLETTTHLDGHYTLDVSSPGVERPLRRATDFARFSGRKARLHTFRPLEKGEVGNDAYWETHKRQKNFVGMLEGLAPSSNGENEKVKMNVDGQTVTVPLALISKAHLEFIEPSI